MHNPQPVHYIHRTSYTVQERLVGIFVLAALSVIVVLLFINSKTAHLFEDRIVLNAYLSEAEGISTETKVKISGIEVGKVDSLDIAPDHRIHLKLIVYKRYQPLLRSDSKASLATLSVLGKAVINITAGSTDKAVLSDGATITIAEPMSVDELMAQLTPVVRDIENTVKRFAAVMAEIEPKQVQSIVANIDASSENIQQVTSKLASNEGSVGMAINDEAMQQRLASTITNIDRAFAQMDKRLRELEQASANINAGTKELPQISQEFRSVLDNTNTLLSNVNIELKQLPELITRMNVLMEESDRLLEGINNSWLFSSEEGRLKRKLIGVQPYHE